MKVTVDKYERKCEVCDNIFRLNPRTGLNWALKTGRGRFCSDKCNRIHRKGIRVSIETEFKRGEQHPSWKANNITTDTKHYRIEVAYGKPKVCEFCGTKDSKRYEWSNKSGDYSLEREDWQRLCSKCHQRYDYEKFGARRVFYEKN